MEFLLESFLFCAKRAGYITVKFLLPKRWSEAIHPESDMAGWIGFFECVFVLLLIIIVIANNWEQQLS